MHPRDIIMLRIMMNFFINFKCEVDLRGKYKVGIWDTEDKTNLYQRNDRPGIGRFY